MADNLHATPEEAAKALAYWDNQRQIGAKRAAIGQGLTGNESAANAVREAWAPLIPDGTELGGSRRTDADD